MNVIFLSDHGMDSVTPTQFIDIRSYLPDVNFEMYSGSPLIQIIPRNAGE